MHFQACKHHKQEAKGRIISYKSNKTPSWLVPTASKTSMEHRKASCLKRPKLFWYHKAVGVDGSFLDQVHHFPPIIINVPGRGLGANLCKRNECMDSEPGYRRDCRSTTSNLETYLLSREESSLWPHFWPQQHKDRFKDALDLYNSLNPRGNKHRIGQARGVYLFNLCRTPPWLCRLHRPGSL